MLVTCFQKGILVPLDSATRAATAPSRMLADGIPGPAPGPLNPVLGNAVWLSTGKFCTFEPIKPEWKRRL